MWYAASGFPKVTNIHIVRRTNNDAKTWNFRDYVLKNCTNGVWTEQILKPI